MGYGIGFALALFVSLLARTVGLDRDRAFYPTVLIVIASDYVLFAVMGGSRDALLIELSVMSAFVVLAVIGFKVSPWVLVAAFAAHGVLDFFHASIVANPGVPVWWPAFCLAFDVGAAGCLAWLSSPPAHSNRRASTL